MRRVGLPLARLEQPEQAPPPLAQPVLAIRLTFSTPRSGPRWWTAGWRWPPPHAPKRPAVARLGANPPARGSQESPASQAWPECECCGHFLPTPTAARASRSSQLLWALACECPTPPPAQASGRLPPVWECGWHALPFQPRPSGLAGAANQPLWVWACACPTPPPAQGPGRWQQAAE